MDQRHLQRIKTIQNLFAFSFNGSKTKFPFANDKKTLAVIKNLKKIDSLIIKFAPRYPIDKIAKSDLSILRLSVYELAIEKKIPHKVAINEAVELSKELSGEKSYAFINAVLGKILDYDQTTTSTRK